MFIRNLNLSKSKTVRNEQAQDIGTVTPGEDGNGNPLHYVTSARTDEESVFHTESAARYWLWAIDEIIGSRLIRGRA